MPLKKDLGDMPEKTKKDRTDGWFPDEPEIVRPAVDDWYESYLAAGKDTLGMAVDGAAYRASWSGNCLRQIQYDRLKVSPSDPLTVADAYRFELGHFVHEEFQKAIAEAVPNARIEMKLPFNVDGDVFGAVHIDLVLPDPMHKGAVMPVEVKSMGGYQYKLAACQFQGPPQGPKFGHLRQLAIEARALQEAGYEVERGKIIYFSTENVGANLIDVSVTGDIGRFVSEWTVSIDELDKRAERQIDEFSQVQVAITSKQLVGRYIPEEAGTVDNPETGNGYQYSPTGEIVGSFKAWQCRYCSHQQTCAGHGDLVDMSEVGS